MGENLTTEGIAVNGTLVGARRGGEEVDMASEVKIALNSLGRKRRVTAGLINKAIVLSTRMQPRVMNTKIFRAVIRRVQRV